MSVSRARNPIAHTGMAGWFHSIPGGGALMAMGIANVAMSATCWWRDCIIESDMGMHTEVGTVRHACRERYSSSMIWVSWSVSPSPESN